jgi:hypothetical protein
MGGAAVVTVSRPHITGRRVPSRVGRIPLSAHVPRAGLRPTLLLYFAARGTRPTRPAGRSGDPTNGTPGAVGVGKLWVLGGPRSEVKGEASAPWPRPEDMSGGDCPTPTARGPQARTAGGATPC